MKWGFMLELSVDSAMPPNLSARPAQLLSNRKEVPQNPDFSVTWP
jgi:hypothetical protein